MVRPPTLSAAAACLLLALGAGCSRPGPDAGEILRAAATEAGKIDRVRYDFRYYGTGLVAGTTDRMEGSVWLESLEPDGEGGAPGPEAEMPAAHKLRVEATITPVDPPGDPYHLTIYRTEQYVYRINARDETLLYSSLYSSGAILQAPVLPALMQPLVVQRSPFRNELEGAATWLGRSKVDGVPCEVIQITHGDGRDGSRWCIGMDDRLPRRMERIADVGSTVLEIRNLKTVPPSTGEFIALEFREGYIPEEYGLGLEVGSVAPDWSLATPAGRTISLRDYRGRVVVMDFWATWCAPCATSMKGLQRIHEEYADRPVAVLGINVQEKGDPVGFMEERGLTYELLLAGEMVHESYARGSIPAFVVIGREGRVAAVAAGYFGEGSERYLRDTIARELAAPSAY